MNVLVPKVLNCLCAVAVASQIFLTSAAQSALFQGLGDLPGGETRSGYDGSYGIAFISRDGSVVVGYSSSAESGSNSEAFRWTQMSGMKGIGSLPAIGNLQYYSGPNAVSADGSVIVGRSLCCSDPDLGNPVQEAFRWTEETGIEGLGLLPGFEPAISRSRAHDVSNDGSVIVGSTQEFADDFVATRASPFRWTRESGMVELDVPLGFEGARSRASHISGDGKVIAGSSRFDGFRAPRTAWLWSEQDGYIEFGRDVYIEDITPDGSVVVGIENGEPFRWTAESGIVPLDGWDSDEFHVNYGVRVTDDGSTIIGTAGHCTRGCPPIPSFIWDKQNGVRDLREVLISEYGLEDQVEGWLVRGAFVATDISGDGRRIAGVGVNFDPTLHTEAWIAILEPALLPGDADEDFDFDQLDLVRVQSAAKYLTGQDATWGDGDWNGEGEGYRFAPVAGDGLFDQLDIVAALGDGAYLTGSYESTTPDTQVGAAEPSVGYDAASGEVWVEVPIGVEITSINIESKSGIFTGDPASWLDGAFDNDSDTNIFKATFGGSFTTVSFGNVARTNLTQDFLQNDLTVSGSQAGGGIINDLPLAFFPVPVPVPSAILLLTVAGACLVYSNRRGPSGVRQQATVLQRFAMRVSCRGDIRESPLLKHRFE